MRFLSNDTSSQDQSDIIYQNLREYQNRALLISLFSSALLGKKNINVLNISVSLLMKKEDIKDTSRIIPLLVREIPADESVIKTLNTVLLLSDLTENDEKPVQILFHELIFRLVAIAANIIVMDINHDNQITMEDIHHISKERAEAIFHMIELAEEKTKQITEKQSQNIYENLLMKLTEIRTNINSQKGADLKEKVLHYLVDIFDKANTVSISLEKVKSDDQNIIMIHSDDTSRDIPISATPLTIDTILKKEAYYIKHIQHDEAGWLPDSRCDALLFNSLAAVSGLNINIELAKDNDGRWYRHHSKDCFKTGESESTISRDMLIGLLIWIRFERKKEILQQIIQYGENHMDEAGNWIMGDGDNTRTRVDKRLQSTFYLVRKFLSGETTDADEYIWFYQQGYQAHLEVLHMLLIISIRQKIFEKEITLLQRYADENPENALFQVVYHKVTDGQLSGVSDILLNQDIFPENRLPDSHDRCSFYLWERRHKEDDGSINPDWAPCSGELKTFSAIDFLFVSFLLKMGKF
ncbi:MAG: hypothetical protein H6618_02575 [Deltaproteobacteria bacterium]|nr:hypothetical protein [Deltaproteobacteria bacterium]